MFSLCFQNKEIFLQVWLLFTNKFDTDHYGLETLPTKVTEHHEYPCLRFSCRKCNSSLASTKQKKNIVVWVLRSIYLCQLNKKKIKIAFEAR